MASDDMLSWLKATIEGDKAAAEAADQASPGPWVNRGQAGEGDAWQIHGALTADSGTEWDEEKQDVVNVGIRVATLNFSDGGGVWEREAADHIALHDPRDTIARCTAELALMDLHMVTEEVEYNGQQGTVTRCPTCPEGTWFPCPTLDALAKTRRYRTGFNPEWATPKPVIVGISEEQI